LEAEEEPMNGMRATQVSAADVRFAVEAARWAPSVHNTQPWRFGVSAGERITLAADPDRRLAEADPHGREMLISCGAALFTLRTAIRRLGRRPLVRLLPDPDRPNLLAEVEFGESLPVTEEIERRYGQIRVRRTHRGAFTDGRLPAALEVALRSQAVREGAILHVAADQHTTGALAALTWAAQHVQRLNPRLAAESARWAPAPRSHRLDGVRHGAYPQQEVVTEPHFPGREFARGHGWGVPDVRSESESAAGAVLMLTTREDRPADWLGAGQALQRILLTAGVAADLSAAFHTQPLEIPELREFIGTRFYRGEHPQMLLRLGVADRGFESVRRPVGEVLDSPLSR